MFELFNHIFVFENYPINMSLFNGSDNPFSIQVVQSVSQTNYNLTIVATLINKLIIQFN